MHCFNSTLVRFKPCTACQVVHTRRHFNSTLVRFKLFLLVLFVRFRLHFNSTLVRFKQPAKCPSSVAFTAFQFHSGAIQTVHTFCSKRDRRNFNSTLVRFKPARRANCDCCSSISIPLWCDSNLYRHTALAHPPNISIPLWCDSNRTAGQTAE